MPNDAKLGLVVGVVVVLSVAVTFFRKPPPQGQAPEPVAAAVTAASVSRPVPAKREPEPAVPAVFSTPPPEPAAVAPPATLPTSLPPCFN